MIEDVNLQYPTL